MNRDKVELSKVLGYHDLRYMGSKYYETPSVDWWGSKVLEE